MDECRFFKANKRHDYVFTGSRETRNGKKFVYLCNYCHNELLVDPFNYNR